MLLIAFIPPLLPPPLASCPDTICSPPPPLPQFGASLPKLVPGIRAGVHIKDLFTVSGAHLDGRWWVHMLLRACLVREHMQRLGQHSSIAVMRALPILPHSSATHTRI